jgi:hypothetical protein
MATKQWKIGERCIGGIIKVTTTGNKITVQALDYYSKKEVDSFSAQADANNAYWELRDFIDRISTSYHESIIIEWICSKIEIKSKLIWR